MFKYMLTLDSGVYALLNKRDKKLLIKSSKNILKSLFAVLSSLEWNQNLYKDRNKLSILILEQTSEHIDILKSIYIDKYLKEGYTLYNKEKLPSYRPRKRVHDDGLWVELVSSGKRVYKVKRLDSHKEANRFIKETSIFDMLRLAKNAV